MIKLPSGVDINHLIDDLRSWSWEASDILLFYSQLIKNPDNKNNILTNKNFADPVTLADLQVNKLIIQRINETYRNVRWNILSEENVKLDSNTSFTIEDWLWVLDPLDGTKDFLQGTGNYAMHLALNYRQKPFLGVVLIPERDELWISNGEKTWCENKNGIRQGLITPKSKNLKDMILVTSKNHKNQVLQKLIDKIGFKNVLEMGSIGCKITSIIKGTCDVYISLSLPGKSSPKDWDFAAPEIILKAGGGNITNAFNKAITYNKPKFEQGGIIIATNNHSSHEKTCLQIRDIITNNDLYSWEF